MSTVSFSCSIRSKAFSTTFCPGVSWVARLLICSVFKSPRCLTALTTVSLHEKLPKSSALSLFFVDVVDIPVAEVVEEGAKAVRSVCCACQLSMLFDCISLSDANEVTDD